MKVKVGVKVQQITENYRQNTYKLTVFDSGSSYFSKVNLQSPTSGLVKSHSSPSVKVATIPSSASSSTCTTLLSPSRRDVKQT